jgi:hypothetical protein
MRYQHEKPLCRSGFQANSLRKLTGKLFSVTGKFPAGTGKFCTASETDQTLDPTPSDGVRMAAFTMMGLVGNSSN